MNSIIKGLLNGNENQVIGQMLLQTEHSIEELIANNEASFSKIYSFLTPTAFSVLMELKEQLGNNFTVCDEDGAAINFDE